MEHKNAKVPQALPFSQLMGYGVGDFALNLFWQLGSFYLMFYLTDVVTLSARSAGTIVAVGAIWSSLVHFTVGWLAERTTGRFGRYRPYIGFGSIPLGLSAIFLFTLPSMSSLASPLVLSVIGLLLFKTFYPFVATPYATLGARLTSDSNQRVKLSGTRMYFANAGGAFIILTVAVLQEFLPDEEALSYASIIAAILAAILFAICFRATETRAERTGSPQYASSLFTAFVAIIHNRALIIFIGAFLLKVVASTILTSTLLYIFIHGYGDKMAGNATLVIMVILPFFAIPVASILAIKLGKPKTWYISSLLSLIGLFSLYLGQDASSAWGIFSYVIIGIGSSFFSVLVWSMIPDAIEYGEYTTGVRVESTIFGSFALIRGFAAMLAALLVGYILDATGYQAGSVVSDDVIDKLFILICFGAGACFVGSMLIMRFYPITAASHASMIEKLDNRSSSATDESTSA